MSGRFRSLVFVYFFQKFISSRHNYDWRQPKTQSLVVWFDLPVLLKGAGTRLIKDDSSPSGVLHLKPKSGRIQVPFWP